MKLLRLNNLAIMKQLQLEEALLRADRGNWCIINSGSPRAIVMGISGKMEKLIDLKRCEKDKIPVIKRFSGGGTVIVDEETVFVTFICNASRFSFPHQPKPILQWSETVYSPLFPGFSLRENDYVFGEKKFGGNAQYIQKERWLHHTSFLWDFEKGNMDYLLLPEKRPEYRKDRSHTDFLCTLRSLYSTKEDLLEALCGHFKTLFDAEMASLEEAEKVLTLPHRTATSKLSTSEF